MVSREISFNVILDVLILGICDEIRNNKEISRKTHLCDHVELVVEPAGIFLYFFFGRQLRKNFLLKTLFNQVNHVVFRGFKSFGKREHRHMILSMFHNNIASLGNIKGIVEGFKIVRKKLQNFIGGMNVVSISGKTHPIRIIHRGFRLLAKPEFMKERIFLIKIVCVDSNSCFNVMFTGNIPDSFHDFIFETEMMILEFKIEMIPVKDREHLIDESIGDFLILLHYGYCLGIVRELLTFDNLTDRSSEGSGNTRGSRNDAFTVFSENVVCDMRFSVEVFRGLRDDVEQVDKTGVVLGKQDHVFASKVRPWNSFISEH